MSEIQIPNELGQSLEWVVLPGEPLVEARILGNARSPRGIVVRADCTNPGCVAKEQAQARREAMRGTELVRRGIVDSRPDGHAVIARVRNMNEIRETLKADFPSCTFNTEGETTP